MDFEWWIGYISHLKRISHQLKFGDAKTAVLTK